MIGLLLARLLPTSLALVLAALLGGGALGGWAGYRLGRAPLQAQLAELRATHSETARLATMASGQRLLRAQSRSTALTTQLTEQLTANDHLTQEKTHALKTATAGRACLSARALGLLNSAPGITVASPGTVPAPGPGAAAPGAPVATDTDIALWIAAAGNAHEQCRARLGALIDWHTETPDPSDKTDGKPP